MRRQLTQCARLAWTKVGACACRPTLSQRARGTCHSIFMKMNTRLLYHRLWDVAFNEGDCPLDFWNLDGDTIFLPSLGRETSPSLQRRCGPWGWEAKLFRYQERCCLEQVWWSHKIWSRTSLSEGTLSQSYWGWDLLASSQPQAKRQGN